MKAPDTSYLIDQLNTWYDNKGVEDQLYYADARSELEEKLHILESVEKNQRIDFMLALSNLMYRSLFKPDEAAKRSHEASSALMAAYLSSDSKRPLRTLSVPEGTDAPYSTEWKRMVEHYDGANLGQFIKTTALYFRKRSEKWGSPSDLGVIKEMSQAFQDQTASNRYINDQKSGMEQAL